MELPNLDEIHECLFDMLIDIDLFCKENNIHYMLGYGSVLGAVRHNGFIPWDDDVDIIMSRQEYERFFCIAEKKLDPTKYTIQRDFSRNWPMTYGKIRLNGTTYIEYENMPKEFHQGFFIDVFPYDNLSNDAFLSTLQWKASRALVSYGNHFRRRDVRGLKKLLLQCLPKKILLEICKMSSCKNSLRVHTYLAGVTRSKNEYLRNDVCKTVEHNFENSRFPIPVGWDVYLRTMYGDYMEFPPVEKRKADIHAIFYDLHKDYTEYL